MLTWEPKHVPRFLDNVIMDADGCWIWIGAVSHGEGNWSYYGSFRIGQKVVRSHVFAAAMFKPRKEKGNHWDHTCNNSLCVNPYHLEEVTPEENNNRRWNGRRKA